MKDNPTNPTTNDPYSNRDSDPKHSKEEPIIDNQLHLEKKKINPYDIFRQGFSFPHAKVSYGITFGEIVINNIELDLKSIKDWKSLPFFWDKLLPLLQPPEFEQEEIAREVKYLG